MFRIESGVIRSVLLESQTGTVSKVSKKFYTSQKKLTTISVKFVDDIILFAASGSVAVKHCCLKEVLNKLLPSSVKWV